VRTFIPFLPKKKQRVLSGFVFLYAVTFFSFCIWWLNSPLKQSNLAGYLATSFLLIFTHSAVWYFYFFLLRMRKLNPSLKVPKFRTALITTRVPSAEPFEITKKTLTAMLKQDYKFKYDVWLADEDPSKEVKKWCKEHGVKISTRKNKPEYHQSTWPRRRKCKEGNLAYFYDHYGYKKYDVVFQFDADHVPKRDYTRRAIKAFNDESIGYIAAPSICSNNADMSWTARGRLYTESIMHGGYQLGLNSGFVPLCFGSHYGVRTKALKEVGGIGPELAEDFSTTFLMNIGGWKGAFVHNAIAIGDGPQTFVDCMKQEFQWSRSINNLLLTLVLKNIRKLGFKQRIQVMYQVFWYPFFALTSLLGFILPLVAIAAGRPIVIVNYWVYMTFTLLQLAIVVTSLYWIRAQGLLRPIDSRVISWEGIFYNLAKWPYNLWGTIKSIMDVTFKKEFVFKITPKSSTNKSILKLTSLLPFVLLIAVPAVLVSFLEEKPSLAGYYLVTISTLFLYLGLFAVILHQQYKTVIENLSARLIKNAALVGLIGIIVVSILHILSSINIPLQLLSSR
jgi:cellulose synthase (UDP-forming)